MSPEFLEFLKLIQGGGNVALIAAAWMLWRAVQSLTRIETFMGTLFEVLLRTEGIKLREGDREMLSRMRSDMRAPRQGGFVMLKFIAVVAGTLALAAFAASAVADDSVSWKHPTQYTDGSALNVADIDATVLRWFDGEDSSTVAGSTAIAAPATTATVPRDSTPGTRCYQAATLMKSGAQSSFAPAAKVCKTIAALKKPKVTTGLTVN